MTSSLRKIVFGYAVLAVMPCVFAQSAPAASLPKPPIRGLVNMGPITFLKDEKEPVLNTMSNAFDHPGLYSGMVVLGKWRDLEPERGKFDFSTIDAGLKHIREYNAKYPKTPVVAKLRIIGATTAPAWAMKIGGGPLVIRHHDADREVAHVWVPDYNTAWHELQNALAARYDKDPLVEEVAIAACSPDAGESLQMPMGQENIQPFLKAGYTNEAMHACWESSASDYDAWKTVALDFTFNPARDVVDGKAVFNMDITKQIMEDFRKRFGARGVLANHGISENIPAFLQPVEDEIKKLGAPIEFQTGHPTGDWDAMFATERALGMTEMEMWDGAGAGGKRPSVEQMKHWRDVLLALPQ